LKFLKKILKYSDDALVILGIIFLFVGFYKIYKPIGFIMFGLCLIAVAYIISKGLGR
jgi:hypothetical protein